LILYYDAVGTVFWHRWCLMGCRQSLMHVSQLITSALLATRGACILTMTWWLPNEQSQTKHTWNRTSINPKSVFSNSTHSLPYSLGLKSLNEEMSQYLQKQDECVCWHHFSNCCIGEESAAICDIRQQIKCNVMLMPELHKYLLV